jgi:hypothetical protein
MSSNSHNGGDYDYNKAENQFNYGDIEQTDETFSKHLFNHINATPSDIVRVSKDSTLWSQCISDARYRDKEVYQYDRVTNRQQTDYNKTAKSTVAEFSTVDLYDSDLADETKESYGHDVIINDDKYDVKITEEDSNGYNICLKRYRKETIQDSIDKKDRAHIMQAYTVERDEYVYIAFTYTLDLHRFSQKYSKLIDQNRSNDGWAWRDGERICRTIRRKHTNIHLINSSICSSISEGGEL